MDSTDIETLSPSEQVNLMKSTQNNPQLITLIDTGDNPDLKEVDLDWKDYVALTIAFMETVFLPIMILMGALVIIAFLFKLL